MRKIVAKYMFKRLAVINNSNRQRAVVNLNEAETVGILCFAGSDQTVPTLKELVKYLKEKNIVPKVLVYVNQKKVPAKYKSDLVFDYFCSKNCNWYGKPKGPIVNRFTETPFSILIDLTLKDRSALKFVASMSMAKLKVGITGNQSADLMIDVSQNKTLVYLIEELKHYLNLINK